MTLMHDYSIEIYSIESQTIVQTIPPPVQPANLPSSMQLDRIALFSAGNGLCIPSAQRSTKLRTTSVPLLRNTKKVATHVTPASNDDLETDVIDPL